MADVERPSNRKSESTGAALLGITVYNFVLFPLFLLHPFCLLHRESWLTISLVNESWSWEQINPDTSVVLRKTLMVTVRDRVPRRHPGVLWLLPATPYGISQGRYPDWRIIIHNKDNYETGKLRKANDTEIQCRSRGGNLRLLPRLCSAFIKVKSRFELQTSLVVINGSGYEETREGRKIDFAVDNSSFLFAEYKNKACCALAFVTLAKVNCNISDFECSGSTKEAAEGTLERGAQVGTE